MNKTVQKAMLLLGGIALLCAAAACGDGPEIEKIRFSSFTEPPATSPSEISYTVETGETITVPTVETQPYQPDIDLRFFNRLGLIDESVAVGNLRSEPSLDGMIIGRFYKNTAMEILADLGDWLQVSSGGIEGYVSKELVLTGDAAREQALRYGDLWVQVIVASGNIRMEPDLTAGIAARVIEGQVYRVIGKTDAWYLVNIGEEEGYIRDDLVKPGLTVAEAENWNFAENLTGPAKAAADFGLRYLGLRYVYGGESMTDGVDCSYFIGMCMYQAGVRLGRTSREQAGQGTAVSAAEMRPGDLLFYSSTGKSIDHVAMYIGDGKILHAAESIGCVSISAYNYCGEPLMVRRYF